MNIFQVFLFKAFFYSQPFRFAPDSVNYLALFVTALLDVGFSDFYSVLEWHKVDKCGSGWFFGLYKWLLLPMTYPGTNQAQKGI